MRLQCAQQTGVDFPPVEECYNSVEGHILLHEVGVKQNALNTTVYWVPWILINDVSIVMLLQPVTGMEYLHKGQLYYIIFQHLFLL